MAAGGEVNGIHNNDANGSGRTIVGQSSRDNRINEMARTMNKHMEQFSGRNSSSVSSAKSYSIFKVPSDIRDIHKEYFEPSLVSIGPFHRWNDRLVSMEAHKSRFLSRLLDGHSTTTTLTIESLIIALEELEAQARGCYLSTRTSSNDLVMMMILDGYFIVELLRLNAKHREGIVVDEPIINTPWVLLNLQRDLLLLENQLPFFVLEKLFELTRLEPDHYSLPELALLFFDPLMPRETKMLCSSGVTPHHLLDLFRSSFLTCFNDNKKSDFRKHFRVKKPWSTKSVTVPAEDWLITNTVTEFTVSGAKFKSKWNCDLIDVCFDNGFLEIPPLFVNDYTGLVLVNFTAYEAGMLSRSETYFTDYVMFLSSLVKSSKDVEILRKYGIIRHALEDDKRVAALFYKLSKNLAYPDENCYWSESFKKFKTKRTRWHKIRAKWMQEYYSNDLYSKPWALLSIVAAVVLLVLTFIQTFFAVFSYARPPS